MSEEHWGNTNKVDANQKVGWPQRIGCACIVLIILGAVMLPGLDRAIEAARPSATPTPTSTSRPTPTVTPTPTATLTPTPTIIPTYAFPDGTSIRITVPESGSVYKPGFIPLVWGLDLPPGDGDAMTLEYTVTIKYYDGEVLEEEQSVIIQCLGSEMCQYDEGMFTKKGVYVVLISTCNQPTCVNASHIYFAVVPFFIQ